MTSILLINPNSSEATTAMMVAMAEATAGPRVKVVGVTAPSGPGMLVNPADLDASVAAVVALGLRHGPDFNGVIVGAFGDPGVTWLRDRLLVPVTGLGEASMREAVAGGRRFGVATTTPYLVDRIDAAAVRLGLGGLYVGTRLTEDDPLALAGDPPRLERALGRAVFQLLSVDGAEAVIIGGGPLSQAAAALSGRFGVSVIAPVAAATRAVLHRIRSSARDR